MANENKKFNYGLYVVAVFVIVTVVLVLLAAFTFKSKYVAFDPEKVAVTAITLTNTLCFLRVINTEISSVSNIFIL